MPELPEVETTLRGIKPHIHGQTVQKVIVRQPQLRWPIPKDLSKAIHNQTIESVERRAKYLLLKTKAGVLIIHLGMSGRLRILQQHVAAEKHDHVDIKFQDRVTLRYTDPRRFGCLLWTDEDPLNHTLLRNLGPEPLSTDFNGDYLYERARGRQCAVKTFIMNSQIVVGVGNIYASEALFLAGISPRRCAQRISLARCHELSDAIKTVLSNAIKAGGTTLRDFLSSDGKPGYFRQKLLVYGREGQACTKCKKLLKRIVIGQRSTVYCSHCQK